MANQFITLDQMATEIVNEINALSPKAQTAFMYCLMTHLGQFPRDSRIDAEFIEELGEDNASHP